MSAAAVISGDCDSRFAAVKAALAANFAERGEVGAAVCVYKDGRKVVDLWGGVADPNTGRRWEQDTIVTMQSVYKGLAALCVHQLIERGRIDIDAPVARYWHGFGQNGKERITVKQLLGGTAGVLYADAAPPNSLGNWPVMIDALERQAPEWPPGTKGAYHSMSAIFLLGELIRQVDGRALPAYFRQEIAEPLGVDFHFGIADGDLARTAWFITSTGSATINAIADRTTKLGRAWHMRPAVPDYFNTPDSHRGVSGHGNARAVARIFAALANGGAIDGVHVVKPQTVELMRQQQWDGICAMTDRHFRYALGFFLNQPPLLPLGPNPKAFGHPGAGGAIGFADPENRLAFSYSPNFMCASAGIGERAAALIEAAYQ